uniref:Uncharacterized protein n=1 Tax=Anguilla anguilla TaxID=7936 RepID=A0A0E9UYS5_ANGAN
MFVQSLHLRCSVNIRENMLIAMVPYVLYILFNKQTHLYHG